MERTNKKQFFIVVVYVSTLIVTIIGATFAYFSASIEAENAVHTTAAEFSIALEDDTSLIKSKLIPSAEDVVNKATILRLDDNSNFIHPYEENGELVTDKTACVDDNLNEICSIYTFTIVNSMTNMELPARITLVPAVNTFTNLYFKVVDEEKNVVMGKTHINNKKEATPDDDNPEGSLKPDPIVLKDVDVRIGKATKDQDGKIIPATATYSIIIWIDETGKDQTKEDGKQIFAGGIQVESISVDGGGITGVFSAGGVE